MMAGRVAMVCSTVSSKMLRAMAQKEGFYFEETLTGFKWMSNKARDLQAQGYTFLFAYEEAIGMPVISLDLFDLFVNFTRIHGGFCCL